MTLSVTLPGHGDTGWDTVLGTAFGAIVAAINGLLAPVKLRASDTTLSLASGSPQTLAGTALAVDSPHTVGTWVTDPEGLIVPQPGTYIVSASITTSTNTTGMSLVIQRNGVNSDWGDAGSVSRLTASGPVSFALGDRVSVSVGQSSGSTVSASVILSAIYVGA